MYFQAKNRILGKVRELRSERDTIVAIGTEQNHISAVPRQRHFSAVVTICYGMLHHRSQSCFPSSICFMEEVATSGVTFCVSQYWEHQANILSPLSTILCSSKHCMVTASLITAIAIVIIIPNNNSNNNNNSWFSTVFFHEWIPLAHFKEVTWSSFHTWGNWGSKSQCLGWIMA